MNETTKPQYATHEYTHKDKKTGAVSKIQKVYRCDADFVPQKQDEICLEFIENYCIKQGEAAIKWLIAQTTQEIELKPEERKFTKSGKAITKRKLSTLEIRKKFVEKYFSNLSVKTEQKTTKGEKRLERLNEELAKISSNTDSQENN